MIYLDNAATTGKKPQSVINAVDSSLREYCARSRQERTRRFNENRCRRV